MNNDQHFHSVTFVQKRKAEVPILGMQVKEEEGKTGEMSGCVFIQKAQVMLQKNEHWWQEGLLAHEKREMYKGRNYCCAFVPL
jgi:hypothetical protein